MFNNLPSSITETTTPCPVTLFSQTPVTLMSCPTKRKLSYNAKATLLYGKQVCSFLTIKLIKPATSAP